ncbi:FHA domain-containing protein [Rhizobium sp. CSW-27]|uniref:FHA domain-containing protein n=1 Tax=Rhizobium sp. CSW-27 TaxID=2839985 RepID=UPI001C029142|nr:FHA domain-containing protein [Rhizobium sp. CSW-27]MBT9373315.1 FHA domain-containing protein [Rhizobium sp. CSW-27]
MSDDERTRVVRPSVMEPGSDAVTRAAGRSATATHRPHLEGDAPATRLARSASPHRAENNVVHDLVAGWLVVVAGPGRGCAREIYFGMNSLGRADNQRISLNFGDETISRESHAFVVFDDMQQDFYIQHGGKSNLVRLNGKPVLAPMELAKGDMIDVGSTRLMFVPLCSETFNWSDTELA